MKTQAKRRTAVLAVAGAATAVAATAMSLTAVADEQAGQSTPDDAAAVECDIEPLAIPDDAVSGTARAVSPDGSHAAGSYSVPSDQGHIEVETHAILWQDGEPRELDFPEGDSRALAVNDSGVVAGHLLTPEWDHLPYVHVDGETFQVPGVDFGRSYDVNNAGHVVGERRDTSLRGEPFIWHVDADEAETLPLPDGAHGGGAEGVDEAGTVVGWHENADRDVVPYAWDADGEGRELASSGDGETRASQVAGNWVLGADDSGDLLWDLDGDDAPGPIELDRAYAVNSQGWVAGADDHRTAVLLTAEERVELPSHGTYPRPARAYGLAADGDLVSGVIDDPDIVGNIPVLWRCG